MSVLLVLKWGKTKLILFGYAVLRESYLQYLQPTSNLKCVSAVLIEFKFLSLKMIMERGNWLVLIDAAKGSATEPLDLSKYPADFVVISFYKVLAKLRL